MILVDIIMMIHDFSGYYNDAIWLCEYYNDDIWF